MRTDRGGGGSGGCDGGVPVGFESVRVGFAVAIAVERFSPLMVSDAL